MFTASSRSSVGDSKHIIKSAAAKESINASSSGLSKKTLLRSSGGDNALLPADGAETPLPGRTVELTNSHRFASVSPRGSAEDATELARFFSRRLAE
jgi:hypothetical protein